MSTEEPILKSRRRRARRACEPCRQRKRKCDGRDPCRTCIEAEYNCNFANEAPRSESRKLYRARQNVLVANDTISNAASSATVLHGARHLSDVEVTNGDRGGATLDPKSRYMAAASAVTFPRILGVELAQGQAPRIHSFAWNLGIRAEIPPAQADVTRLISLEEVEELSMIYFAVVHAHFGFLDHASFLRDCTNRWLGSSTNHQDDTIICGVAALGSFFSSAPNQALETVLVEHAREVLQSSSVVYFPGPKTVGAWILRTLYLRLTTRPHASWIASCTAVHISEATGLHKDLPKDLAQRSPGNADDELRRRMFWTVWSLHTILSYEYGRSSINLPYTCRDPPGPVPGHGPYTDLLLIARIVASDQSSDQASDDKIEKSNSLENNLQNLMDLTLHLGVCTMIRTDMVFATYRHLRLLRHQFTMDQLSSIIKIGCDAMSQARILALDNLAWWNIISTPFQFICILLAIDSAESLSAIPQVMTTLEEIGRLFDTHMVQEAIQVAKSLLKMARDRKAEDLKKLDSYVPVVEEPDQGTDFPGLNDQTFMNWPDDPFDWEILFQQIKT